MRFLICSLVVAVAVPAFGADNDEDKAKEAVKAFLKALAEQDADAAIKRVDTPFMIKVGSSTPTTINKSDELKDLIAKLVKLSDKDVTTFEVGKVYDMAGIAKYAKEMKSPELVEQAEKILGKTGYMVMVVEKGGEEISPGFLVRIKDGKAFVAGLPK